MNTMLEYFQNRQLKNGKPRHEIHSCPELVECIQAVGFLPLLESGIPGFSAEALMADECRYKVLPDGSWEWPLWKWKGPIIGEGDCVYGKFFACKAGFVSLDWWPDLCNYRRSVYPLDADGGDAGAVAGIILDTLREHGSMVSRDLRAACGLVGPRMRSLFDGYVTRLQMACRIVTEDFVYPRDKHGHEYGWGLSLLTTPERLLGGESLSVLKGRTPEESHRRMKEHLRQLLPDATEKQILKILK